MGECWLFVYWILYYCVVPDVLAGEKQSRMDIHIGNNRDYDFCQVECVCVHHISFIEQCNSLAGYRYINERNE